MTISVPTDRHHRSSIRLPEFDYSRVGSYFVTICAHERRCIFGEVAGGEMRLNDFGQIVREEWEKTSVLRANVELGAFVVMPNHFHAIVHIVEESPVVGIMEDVGGRGTARCAPTDERENSEKFGKPVSGSIPTIVRSYKSAVTKRINELRNTPGFPVWQRNYYDPTRKNRSGAHTDRTGAGNSRHIIETDKEYLTIEGYILENPMHWMKDSLYLP
jgi:REP element-mobilizing transposase RayT